MSDETVNVIETYSTEPKVIRFNLQGSNGIEDWELCEMVSSQRDLYMDRVGERAKTNDQGEIVGIKKYEGMYSDLLTLCVRRKGGALVTKEEAQKWPASLSSKLYGQARNLSELNKKDTDEKKD